MVEKKYSRCEWCGRTIDITKKNRQLCTDCEKYPNYESLIKAEAEKRIKK